MKTTITRGFPYPLGVNKCGSGINVSHVYEGDDCGIVFFDKNGEKEKCRVPFPKEYSVGNVHCMHLSGEDLDGAVYCFCEGDGLISDERGAAYLGGQIYGAKAVTEHLRLSRVPFAEYDWEGDTFPCISYENGIGYCLHVRGFTRHASSGVKGKGTFRGVIEKLPYLKELGVTTLELQPVYEFDEIEKIKKQSAPFADKEELAQGKLNYWGYTKGFYYSPKNSYAFSEDACTEFKDMVKALHKNGMEVILQFYFTTEMSEAEVPQILAHWVREYHVDGFHLKGEAVSTGLVAAEPALSKSKLWYYDFPEKQVEGQRLLAEYREEYRYDMRRFLKGDEGMLQAVMYHLRRNPAFFGRINYLTNYDGFTMMDMVSYERKHNEANGEDNQDGNDYNESWNCGQEGVSRKKTVIALRKKQLKNAFLLLLLSQGMPLFFMGDEFGNSQKGNNNPYCQDNEITWLNWKNKESNCTLFSFVKELIAFRKEHPVFRQEKELRLIDYGACGYPDLSYHGEAPWKPDTAGYSRQLGVLYCGKYVQKAKHTPDDFFYVAYNMHWESYTFALPKLPKGFDWKLHTASDEAACIATDAEQPVLTAPPRSICVLIGTDRKGK